ncbi:MAG: hypothetical protein ACTHK7_19585 [Aureliella sp.]
MLLELRGKPAAAYLRLFAQDVPDDVGASLEARVIKIDAGSIVAQSQAMLPLNADPTRIVTVTATFRRDALQGPSGYTASIGPEMNNSGKQVFDQRTRQAGLPRVRIDSFEQTRIRTWALEREVTE